MAGGVYHLESTIELNEQDSGLTIQNQDSDEVWISGGKLINPKWSTQGNFSVTDLDEEAVYGLRINGQRAIRARYPNANPEEGFGSSLKAKGY